MSDQAPTSRRRRWIIPTAFLAASALAAAAGLADFPVQPARTWWFYAILFAVAAALVTFWEWRSRPAASTTPVEIEPGLAAAVRAERESVGEVAAVRMLRTEQPELSLVDAAQLVRGL